MKAFTLFDGVLMLVIGVLASLAFAIGIVFSLEGVVSMLVALGHTRVSGCGWGLLNGIPRVQQRCHLDPRRADRDHAGLGSALGDWVLVGTSFLFSGIDLLAFSASLHAED